MFCSCVPARQMARAKNGMADGTKMESPTNSWRRPAKSSHIDWPGITRRQRLLLDVTREVRPKWPATVCMLCYFDCGLLGLVCILLHLCSRFCFDCWGWFAVLHDGSKMARVSHWLGRSEFTSKRQDLYFTFGGKTSREMADACLWQILLDRLNAIASGTGGVPGLVGVRPSVLVRNRRCSAADVYTVIVSKFVDKDERPVRHERVLYCDNVACK